MGTLLADSLERHDATITAGEFKAKMEGALRQWDTEDYDRGAEGMLIPMARLYALEIILDAVLPRPFADGVRAAYNYRRAREEK